MLIRRRKNNPAIAEGVAQILAAPDTMERLDELFDRDEDGEFERKEDIERIRMLARQCPAKLRNHRIILMELTNLVTGTKYRGKFEERLHAIVEVVTDKRAPPTILFIDGECFVYTGRAVWDNLSAGSATQIGACLLSTS